LGFIDEKNGIPYRQNGGLLIFHPNGVFINHDPESAFYWLEKDRTKLIL